MVACLAAVAAMVRAALAAAAPAMAWAAEGHAAVLRGRAHLVRVGAPRKVRVRVQFGCAFSRARAWCRMVHPVRVRVRGTVRVGVRVRGRG